MQKDAEILKNKETHPHIIVATPGRLNALVRDKHLRLSNCKVFVLDECDKMLEAIGKRDNFCRVSLTDKSVQICAAMSRKSFALPQRRSRS